MVYKVSLTHLDGSVDRFTWRGRLLNPAMAKRMQRWLDGFDKLPPMPVKRR